MIRIEKENLIFVSVHYDFNEPIDQFYLYLKNDEVEHTLRRPLATIRYIQDNWYFSAMNMDSRIVGGTSGIVRGVEEVVLTTIDLKEIFEFMALLGNPKPGPDLEKYLSQFYKTK